MLQVALFTVEELAKDGLWKSSDQTPMEQLGKTSPLTDRAVLWCLCQAKPTASEDDGNVGHGFNTAIANGKAMGPITAYGMDLTRPAPILPAGLPPAVGCIML